MIESEIRGGCLEVGLDLIHVAAELLAKPATAQTLGMAVHRVLSAAAR